MKASHQLDAAVECVVRAGRASTALLSRSLRIGGAEARRLLHALEWLGVVERVGGRRAVRLTPDDWADVVSADAP